MMAVAESGSGTKLTNFGGCEYVSIRGQSGRGQNPVA